MDAIDFQLLEFDQKFYKVEGHVDRLDCVDEC